MEKLPPEIIRLISSYLPSKHHLKSTCKLLNRIIPPGDDIRWYYELLNKYDIPLQLHGDIGKYNQIFNTSFRSWKDVYDIYTYNYDIDYDVIDYHRLGIYKRTVLIATNINHILSYDIHYLYRIGILRLLPNIRELPQTIWDMLSVEEIYGILDTNCINVTSSSYNISSILRQYISRTDDTTNIVELNPYYIIRGILADEMLYQKIHSIISTIFDRLDQEKQRKLLHNIGNVLTVTEKIRLLDVDIHKYVKYLSFIVRSNYEYNILHEHIVQSIYLKALRSGGGIDLPIPHSLPFFYNTEKVVKYYSRWLI
jgi:hypothetical protein